MPATMVVVFALGFWASDPPAREDAVALLQRVIDAQPRYQEAQRAYAYRQRAVTEKLDEDGTIADTESETHLVTPAPGGEYERRIARDGRPLSPKDAAAEERKLQKHIQEQLELSEQDRDELSRKTLEKRVERYQKRLKEALEVFDFEPIPDATVDGERVRVFAFRPKDGYEGHSRETKVLARMEGRVWIDAKRDQLVKLSVRFTRDLSFLGGVFGRVSKGTEATAAGELHDDLWLVDDVDVFLDARLYFFKRYRQRISIDYDDYRRFSIETRETLTPVSPQR